MVSLNPSCAGRNCVNMRYGEENPSAGRLVSLPVQTLIDLVPSTPQFLRRLYGKLL